MAYANAVKYNRIKSMKGLPIGAILPWASDQGTIPPGWVLCNGVVTSITRYPLLFEVIGNTYGGTEGSTFRLPPLTNTSQSIVDVFRGHYQYLKTNGGEANAPVSNSIDTDEFWKIVAGGNGDQGSTARTEWRSPVDLVGEFVARPNMFATYDPITVSDGSFSWTAVWNPQNLRDTDLQAHTHSNSGGQTDSYQYGGGAARARFGTTCAGDVPCNISSEGTTGFRVAANPEVAADGAPWRANNATHLQNNFLTTDTGSSGATTGVGTGGGGNVRGVPPFSGGGRGESGATVYDGGDGICTGSMSCGFPALFTSLSNNETNRSVEHFHGTTTYNISSRYIVISPGLRDNISLNTVQVNNTPGRNFGSIEVTTATPSLEMLYIIRAY